MKPLYTFTEIREIEKQIIEKDNFPSIVLMENAGKNSFDILLKEFSGLSDYQIFILCGKGNNAGDGYTLARHLAINGFDFKIVALEPAEALKGDALINFESLIKCVPSKDLIIDFNSFSSLVKSFSRSTKILVIDSLLGTGISGELSPKYDESIKEINQLKVRFKKLKVVSLDIPSGLTGGKQINRVVNADMTISMGTMKTELLYGAGKECSGEIHIAPIGITSLLISKYDRFGKSIVELPDVKKLLPKRRKTSHKYSNGKLLVIGGSKGLSGAVVMSSLSAIKSGAGGVAAAIPASISAMLGKKHFDIMRLELDDSSEYSISASSFGMLEKRLAWCDAVLLGPGISTSAETGSFVYDVVKNCNKPMVIDADALTLIAEDINVLKRRENNSVVILTPHLGEFSRLSKLSVEEIQNNRFEAVRNFAAEFKVNVVLKSETSLSCTESGSIYVNSTGNQLLAEAGSGDVLSGIIASVLAQSGDVNSAMICGNYIHGLCADLLAVKLGNKQSASPMDIMKMIPVAITHILER